MKKSFDEYKKLYEKANSVIEKEPISTDFELYITVEWFSQV